ncbi:MAG: hypothetical protein ACI4EE_14380 [Lachnospiraceae bacterium]
MKRKVTLLFIVCALSLTACGHEHTFSEATCTEPKTCTVCGATEGEPVGHSFEDATCTRPATCSICGATRGSKLDHDWIDATCTAPSTCSRCGETKGEPLEHVVENGEIISEPTCTEPGEIKGICSMCNQEVVAKLEPLGHTYGEFEISVPATYYSPGEKVKTCSVCGKVLATTTYELSDAEKEDGFKADCPTWTYEQIARDPDSVLGDNAKFTGQVIQVIENGQYCEMRVDITKTGYGYKDTIYVTYTRKSGEDRILDDDIITIWGWLEGTKTYTSVIGNPVTLPYVEAQYLRIE